MGLTFPRVSRIDRIILLFFEDKPKTSESIPKSSSFLSRYLWVEIEKCNCEIVEVFLIQQPIVKPVPFLKYQICLVVNL